MASSNIGDSKREELRESLWPSSGSFIFDYKQRAKTKGFARMSRLMPWVAHLIGILARPRPDPSPVFWELWCRDWGQGIVTITDEEECAYAAGYASSRGLRTWRAHMLTLKELGFILTKPLGRREYGQVFLPNPLGVCARYQIENKVPEAWWTSFKTRAEEIGAFIPQGERYQKLSGLYKPNGNST